MGTSEDRRIARGINDPHYLIQNDEGSENLVPSRPGLSHYNSQNKAE